jgi:hypothetical protein
MEEGDMVDAPDQPHSSDIATETSRPPRPRSPLIIGGIACGMIVWMFVVVMLLIAWKVLS